jgi:hypothetical protein
LSKLNFHGRGWIRPDFIADYSSSRLLCFGSGKGTLIFKIKYGVFEAKTGNAPKNKSKMAKNRLDSFCMQGFVFEPDGDLFSFKSGWRAEREKKKPSVSFVLYKYSFFPDAGRPVDILLGQVNERTAGNVITGLKVALCECYRQGDFVTVGGILLWAVMSGPSHGSS